MLELVDFGEAIKAPKQGKRIQRKGWNGNFMFVCMQVPSEIDKEIVPKMQSLPKAAKDEFVKRFEGKYPPGQPSVNFEAIRYKNQLIMVYPDNNIYGWVASPSDILEEDWIIMD